MRRQRTPCGWVCACNVYSVYEGVVVLRFCRSTFYLIRVLGGGALVSISAVLLVVVGCYWFICKFVLLCDVQGRKSVAVVCETVLWDCSSTVRVPALSGLYNNGFVVCEVDAMESTCISGILEESWYTLSHYSPTIVSARAKSCWSSQFSSVRSRNLMVSVCFIS